MKFKSQRVEPGISILFKSSLEDSNLLPGLGKSAWGQGSLLPCIEMAFLSSVFLRTDFEAINQAVSILQIRTISLWDYEIKLQLKACFSNIN